MTNHTNMIEAHKTEVDLPSGSFIGRGRIKYGGVERTLLFLHLEPGRVSFIEQQADGSNRLCQYVDDDFEMRRQTYADRDKISQIPWSPLKPSQTVQNSIHPSGQNIRQELMEA